MTNFHTTVRQLLLDHLDREPASAFVLAAKIRQSIPMTSDLALLSVGSGLRELVLEDVVIETTAGFVKV